MFWNGSSITQQRAQCLEFALGKRHYVIATPYYTRKLWTVLYKVISAIYAL